ncbi:LacI family DNA-binding transcriptional regulator [Brachybacterium subflavum]|uniref:LacI family DNA-binding transcriptional regulator n=1 Tax=Brachybacterium subflavum TaxID=2585206 RepID=UPI001266794B|nr:LacI family DNA-binding transcriptional regulator [Brachybacterium subflavum]
MPPGPHSRGAPTMKDVAREAGVSKALVSIVFRRAPGASEATRQKVLEAARTLGYRPHRGASMLALTRTRQLGIVHDLHNGFHAQIADAALAAAERAGYRLVMTPRTRTQDEPAALASALELRSEALLVLGSTLPEAERDLLTGDVPVVSIGRAARGPATDWAMSSDEAGMELLVEHLVARGRRRLVHLDGGAGEVSARRREGFEAAAGRRGGEVDAHVVPGGPTEADGRRAAEAALAHSPTALLAFNDLAALGALDAAMAAGLAVPDQLAVTGWDDSALARTQALSLTSVRQDADELGRWAVEAALERLDEGRTEARSLILEPALRVRRSTGGDG